MNVELPKEFFTLQSMLTLTGATGATYVVANGLQAAFNFNPRWLALVIAQAISFFGVYSAHGEGSDYFIAFINGFLIYCTAAGATSVSSKPHVNVRPRGEDAIVSSNRRQFFSQWF